MCKPAVVVCVALSLCSAARAGVIIDLVPTEPGPYMPGERVEVELQLTQQPGGEDVYIRLLCFDFLRTDPALVLDEAFQFDYSAQAVCAQDPGQCGTLYAEFPELTPYGDWGIVTSIAYIGLHQDSDTQIVLPAAGTISVGSIGVTLPTEPGEYLLDALNPTEPDLDAGARLDFGFGFPDDPIVSWRAYDLEAVAGGMFLSTGTARVGFQFEYQPIPGVMVPEPTTLGLVVAGVLAGLARRRTRKV
jgi:hypothetical protein